MFDPGFLLFLAIITMAFWLLIFLAGFALPYALTVWLRNKISPYDTEEEAASED